MPRGRFSSKQLQYTELVAGGTPELKAVLECGYSEKTAHQSLAKLRSNPRVLERIARLKSNKKETPTADRQERLEFWTEVMRDPKNSLRVRMDASSLLGKAHGDFIDKREVKQSNKGAVLMVPSITKEQWEKYYGKTDTQTVGKEGMAEEQTPLDSPDK